MNIPIIFENEDFLIINKPEGLVMHPFDFSNEETVLDFLKNKYPEMFSNQDFVNEFKLQDERIINLGGIVHKLDRWTSGVIVVAKSKKAFDQLKEQLINHKVEKVYEAMVEGKVEKDEQIIDAPLGRNKKDYKQTVNPTNPRGELRNAVTEVKVINRLEDRTLVELSPITGRTHQLRAHMSYIGHPIVGDISYGSKLASERIMLHAKKLSFDLFGKKFEFEVKSGF